MSIHSTAIISPTSTISDTVVIGPFVVVEGNVIIDDEVTIFAGAYIGKPPKAAGVIKRELKAFDQTRIGRGSVIGSHAVIYQGVVLNDGVLIGDGACVRENTYIGKNSLVGSNSTIQNDAIIGDRVRIVDLSHITAHVVIEDDVFWSVGVLSMNDNAMAAGGKLQPPKVRHGAHIGGGALLLPGVEVGAASTVAAGAVVTRDVPAGKTVFGIPAKQRDAAEVVENKRLFDAFYGALGESWDGSMLPEELPQPAASGWQLSDCE